MRIIVNGAAGRMGGIICRMIEEDPELVLAAACDRCDGFPCVSDITAPADVLIDFSSHEATRELAQYAAGRGIPLVIATTGRTAEEDEVVKACAKNVAVFCSANMSVGVALLCELVKKAAHTFPAAEIELIERHHDRKLDVPSGTALMLANAVCEERPNSRIVVGRHENGRRSPEDIGIHSLRLGNEVGTHEVIFSCGNETVTVTHRAEDRALFADGALAAARFIAGKPAGLYSMKDIVGI